MFLWEAFLQRLSVILNSAWRESWGKDGKMEAECLVSVIIPVYNTEKYLRKCVDSVRNQTYQNLEIWLVDDGSTDSSGAICDEYAQKDSRIYVIHKENAGQGMARNAALDRCTGKYIAFVDSDDWIELSYVEKLVFEIERADADICICGYYGHTGIKTVNVAHAHCVLYSTYTIMKHKVTTTDITGVPWDKLYRRHLLESIRYPAVRANEDAYLISDVLQLCKRAVIIEDCLYHQLIRPGSTEQANFSDKNYALIGASEKLMAIVKNNYPDLYAYVQFKAADDICNLLYKVVYSGESAENQKHYATLNEYLLKELKRIKDTEEILDKEKFANLESCALHVEETKRKLRKRAHKERLKRRIKQLALQLKGY